MGSLGETLRQARLDRGASLADAEAETRIRRRYLEAIENEEYGVLPPLVYTRGLIRSYARYLGLDPEATLDLFQPARSREERPAIKPAMAQQTPVRSLSTRLFVLGGGLVLVGMLLLYLWTQYTSFVESIGPGGSSALTSAVASPGRSGASASPVAGVTPAPPPVAAVPVSAEPTAAAVPTPIHGIVLEARVTERTWMEVWVDGNSQLQATLQTGTVRTFQANQSLRMRVGNAGGVEVTVNGQAQGPLGSRNQVKEVVWER